MTYFLYSNSYNSSLIQNNLLESNLLSQGSIEQDHLPKNVKNFGSDKKIIFSTESVKKNLFKMLIKILLKWKICTKI